MAHVKTDRFADHPDVVKAKDEAAKLRAAGKLEYDAAEAVWHAALNKMSVTIKRGEHMVRLAKLEAEARILRARLESGDDSADNRDGENASAEKADDKR